jgi:hypothetical protein
LSSLPFLLFFVLTFSFFPIWEFCLICTNSHTILLKNDCEVSV